MNWKTRTGALPVSRANQAAAFDRDIALQPQLLVLTPQTGQLLALGAVGQPLLSAAFIAVGLARPSARSTGRSVQTRGQDRQDYVQHGRDRPSVGETPANTVDVFLASETPPSKA